MRIYSTQILGLATSGEDLFWVESIEILHNGDMRLTYQDKSYKDVAQVLCGQEITVTPADIDQVLSKLKVLGFEI